MISKINGQRIDFSATNFIILFDEDRPNVKSALETAGCKSAAWSVGSTTLSAFKYYDDGASDATSVAVWTLFIDIADVQEVQAVLDSME